MDRDRDLSVFKQFVDGYECSSRLIRKFCPSKIDQKPKVYLYVRGMVESAEYSFKVLVGKAIGMINDEILFCESILYVRYPSKHLLSGYKDKLVDIADGTTRTAVVFGKWKEIAIEPDNS